MLSTVADEASTAAPRRRQGPRRRRLRLGKLPLPVAALGWLVVAGLGVVALVRIFAWDSLWWPFVLLDAGTWELFLPAWLVALVALAGRRLVLGAAAVAVVAAQLAFVLPELTAASPLPSWTKTAATFRLLDANVDSTNSSLDGYAAQIRSFRPSLVTMEEVTPYLASGLLRSGALAGLPHRFEVDQWDPFGFFIASRFAFHVDDTLYDFGRPLGVLLTLELPSGALHVLVVHTVAPLPPTWTQWNGDLAMIAATIRRVGTAHLLVAGDFNATWGNRGFRDVLATGVVDAGAARGQALTMTWSQQLGFLPPLVRIDHLLTGPSVAVTRISTHTGVGSDHRDLYATVAVKAR